MNGLGSPSKRAQVLSHLLVNDPDILFLCDSRLGQAGQNSLINHYPDYYFYFNSSNSQARGVDIIINRKFPIEITDSWGDEDGNILILLGSFDGDAIVFCNIYGPNSDDPNYFSNLFDRLQGFGTDYIILGGDFNVYIDPVIDSLGYNSIRTPGARRIILDALSHGGFIDPFRLLHKQKKEFTWQRFNSSQSARLDYFLTTSSMSNFIVSCTSFPAFRSDHKPINIIIDLKKIKKGKGLWRFNNRLLLDSNFVDLVKKEIKICCAKYLVHPVYSNFLNDAPIGEVDTFLNAPLADLEQLEFNIDFDTLLICIFNDIKNLSISYASGRGKSNKALAKNLLREIGIAPEGPGKQALLDQYNLLMETSANEHLSNIARLSKLEGERPSRWFLRLEKANNAQKFLGEIVNERGDKVTSQDGIEQEIRCFYQDLYAESGHQVNSPDELKSFMPANIVPPSLSNVQSNFLESDITLDEIADFLRNINLDSSPGYSGISYHFIKIFFKPLGTFMVKAAKAIFDKGILPTAFRIGIISLIPKGNKDKRFLQNWRPICLLDSCYKIFSGVLTKRLNKVLPSIIDIAQSGFIPGRCLNDSLRILTDVLEWGNRYKQPGIILSIDYRKAFDTISHSFIINSLKFFGFKENFIRWVKITQNDFMACTSNAGNISPPFKLSRGAKQGDPLSPGLFIIGLEVLSLRIRNDPGIIGYKMGSLELRVNYFADDSVYLLDRNEQSVNKVVNIIDTFANLSGLHMNKDKSALIEFGVRPRIPFCVNLPFKRLKEFDYLGFAFTSDLSNMEKNVDIKLEEIKKICNNWRNRNMTIYGRSVLAKTIMISKINNILMILPNTNRKSLKIFESQIYNFIWKGKDQVRRFDSKISEFNGGLNLPNIFTAVEAFKISWFRRLFNVETIWGKILNVLIAKVKPNFNFNSLLELGDLGWAKLASKIPSAFWKVCLKAPISPCRDFLKSRSDLLLDLNLWDCSFLTSQNRAFFPHQYPSLRKKIRFISELVNPNTNALFLPIEFVTFFGEVNLPQLEKILDVVRAFLLSKGFNPDRLVPVLPQRPLWLAFFNITNKGCRGWTRILRSYKSDNIRKREENWEGILGLRLGPLYWDKIYKLLTTLTYNNKLKYFQYQLNRGCLNLNNIISKFVPGQSDRCTFCNNHKEDIIHLFWSCDIVQAFKISLGPFLNQLNVTWPPPSRESFLFGCHKSSFCSEQEYIYLLIKHFIWISRCLKTELSLASCKNKISFMISSDLCHVGQRPRGGGEGGGVTTLGTDPFMFISSLANRLGIG